MKAFRNVIIIILILAVLSVAYYFVTKLVPNNGKPTASDAGTTYLIDVDEANVASFSIKNSSGDYTFLKVATNNWELQSDPTIKLDQDVINAMFTQAISISSKGKVTDNAKNFAQYGLNKPLILSIKLNDGSIKQLELGGQNPSKESHYARYPGGKTIYLVDVYLYDTLEFKLYDIRDNKIFDVELGDINGYKLTRDGSLAYYVKRNQINWTIEEPIFSIADTSVLSDIFSTMVELKKISHIEADAKNLKKYGLDTPKYVLELTTPTDKITLSLGDDRVRGSEIYAKLGDSNEIFTLDIANLNFIDKPAGELMDIFVFNIPIGDVKNVKVTMDGNTTNMAIVSDGINNENDKFTVNGKDMSDIANGTQTARRYYQALIGLERIAAVRPAAKPAGKAVATITYTLEVKPYTMKIEFVSKDSKYYYIIKNGKYLGLTMKKSEFNVSDGVRKSYSNLAKLLK